MGMSNKCKVTFTKTGCIVAAALLFGLPAACKKDDDETKNGKPIGAPAIEPPVSRNVPAGLKSSTNLKLDETSDKAKALAAVKQMLSEGTTGPSTLIYRLKMVDGRVSELDRRASDSPVEKACLLASVEATDYNVGGSLPGGENAGMKFQCQEEITESPSGIAAAQLAFGLTDETFYLMERTVSTNGNGIMVLAKASMNGTATEAWQIATDGDNADFRHIKAKDGKGLEATIAGSKTTGDAAACGIHVKSNGTHVYLKGKVSHGSQGCSNELTICYDASTGSEVATDTCRAADLNTFELTSLTPELAQAAVADAKAMIAQSISGYIDFTKDAPVADEK